LSLERALILCAFSISSSVIYSLLILFAIPYYYAWILIYLHDTASYIVSAYITAVILASILTKKKQLLELLSLTPGLYLALILPPEIAWSITP